MTYIEMILINDLSKDETLSVVELFKNKEPRIKIINNQKKYGNIIFKKY